MCQNRLTTILGGHNAVLHYAIQLLTKCRTLVVAFNLFEASKLSVSVKTFFTLERGVAQQSFIFSLFTVRSVKLINALCSVQHFQKNAYYLETFKLFSYKKIRAQGPIWF